MIPDMSGDISYEQRQMTLLLQEHKQLVRADVEILVVVSRTRLECVAPRRWYLSKLSHIYVPVDEKKAF
jgi:hypothetical protein